MRDFGYDVSNYTEVDDLFGTMDDFDDLIKEAKSKGNWAKGAVSLYICYLSENHKQKKYAIK